MAASRPTAVLLALLAVLVHCAEGHGSGLGISRHIDLPYRVRIPNAPHNPLCVPAGHALCNSIAARLPKVTPWTLVEAIIEGGKVKAAEANMTWVKLSQDQSFKGIERSCFEQCQDSSDQMAGVLDEALQLLARGDVNSIDTAKVKVDATSAILEDCEDCFTEMGSTTPPIAARLSKNLRNWATTAIQYDVVGLKKVPRH